MLLVQNLRLVWFSNELAAGDGSRLFRSLFHEDPERSSSAKQPTAQNPFVETAGGQINGFNVEIQRQLGRLDLILQPVEPSDMPMPDVLPNLVPMVEFSTVVLKFLASADWLPLSHRISTAAACFSPATSLDDGRRQFCEYINHDFRIPDSSDLVLQINRKAELGGFDCHRILQISSVIFQGVEIAANANGVSESIVSSSFALSVMHDFNTVPSSKIIAQDEQFNIFSALISEIERATKISNISFLGDN